MRTWTGLCSHRPLGRGTSQGGPGESHVGGAVGFHKDEPGAPEPRAVFDRCGAPMDGKSEIAV
ncbi:hypothetical protein GCM10009675_21450 [Prauserella alba]|uniref:Uncharacterized protein n=1 Tax=Prauserella alba TaxID=176898 RepID=A0ABP4FW24_9PSEU